MNGTTTGVTEAGLQNDGGIFPVPVAATYSTARAPPSSHIVRLVPGVAVLGVAGQILDDRQLPAPKVGCLAAEHLPELGLQMHLAECQKPLRPPLYVCAFVRGYLLFGSSPSVGSQLLRGGRGGAGRLREVFLQVGRYGQVTP